MSVFFIEISLVAVGAEQDVRHPIRRSAHLLTDRIQVNVRAGFDDQCIQRTPTDGFAEQNGRDAERAD